MLLMIDNYDSFTYNLVQYLGELGIPATVRPFRQALHRDAEASLAQPYDQGSELFVSKILASEFHCCDPDAQPRVATISIFGATERTNF